MLRIGMKVGKEWILIIKEYLRVFLQQQEKLLKINFLTHKNMLRNLNKNLQ